MANTSQTRRFDQIENELKKLNGDFQTTKIEVATMNSSLVALTETVEENSQIISSIKMTVSAISKDIMTYERKNHRMHNATMKKLDLLCDTFLSF